jgi:hypothetical protein
MGESVWKALLCFKHAGQWALWLCKRIVNIISWLVS